MTRHLMMMTGLLAIAGPAVAQYPYPYQSPYGQQPSASPPVLSPYLNLRNGGNNNNAGVNYYNFVRPQLQLQQQQMLAGSSYNPALEPFPLASDINVLPDSRLPRATGLPVTFMNYGPYFNSLGSIGSAGRPPQAAGAPNAGRSPVAGAPTQGNRR